MSDDPFGRELDNVDSWRTPTASQAAGLTLAAAGRIIAAAQGIARELRVAMSVAWRLVGETVGCIRPAALTLPGSV